jgi:hypothetical protein
LWLIALNESTFIQSQAALPANISHCDSPNKQNQITPEGEILAKSTNGNRQASSVTKQKA